jgi:hypothetical protein
VRRAAIIWGAKNDPLTTLCLLTSPLLEDFPVLALLDSARVVLGSSKVPLEFRGAHPELRSGTRFGDESMDNLFVEVQHLIKIQMKRKFKSCLHSLLDFISSNYINYIKGHLIKIILSENKLR